LACPVNRLLHPLVSLLSFNLPHLLHPFLQHPAVERVPIDRALWIVGH